MIGVAVFDDLVSYLAWSKSCRTLNIFTSMWFKIDQINYLKPQKATHALQIKFVLLGYYTKHVNIQGIKKYHNNFFIDN